MPKSKIRKIKGFLGEESAEHPTLPLPVRGRCPSKKKKEIRNTYSYPETAPKPYLKFKLPKSKIKYQNRKYRINNDIYVISNVYCLPFDVDISFFQWDNYFCKKGNKERNKQNESSKFKIQFFVKFLALKFCSTSPPGGNQIDGLPPVVKSSYDS